MTRFLRITRINHVKGAQYGDIKNVTRIVVRVVHACCWEIKVTRVLQNLSNLKVGHFFFFLMFISVWCKVSFLPGAPGELLEDSQTP